uniref:RNA polymerase n=1 Tax=Methylophaga nitratireducenticrescens TaxID=754476 RepID=I1XF95_METNJ
MLIQERAIELRAPKAYLSSVARGLLIDLFRRRSVEQAYLDALKEQPEQNDISAETRHSIIETLLEIDRMLDSLSERSRQIFLMAQLDGLSYTEIGRRLGISVNTVRKHFIRAMTQCLLMIED